MTDAEFLKLVDAGIDALPEHVRAHMGNVAIVIADEPSDLQRKENSIGFNDILFGLYEGIPQTERGLSEEILLPDKITIFKNAVLETYESPQDIATCVANTVWHEVAHHFGMDEDEVEQEEIKRGKIL